MQDAEIAAEPVGLEYLEQELRSLGVFYYWPNHGNIGDLLIAEATRQYFSRKGLNWKAYDPHNPPDGEYSIVYGGGGRFSAHWRGPVGGVEPLVSKAVRKCVILPHSYNGVDKELALFDERHVLFCREMKSYHYVRSVARASQVVLADDMALGYDVSSASQQGENLHPNRPQKEDMESQKRWLDALGEKRMLRLVKRATVFESGQNRRVSFLMRSDAEKKTGLDSPLTYDISAEWNGNCEETPYSSRMLRALVDALDQTDVVVTDRLHVSIMAAILGKRVYMMDNDYGKLSAVYSQSLQGIDALTLCASEAEWPEEIRADWKQLNRPTLIFFYRIAAVWNRCVRMLKSPRALRNAIKRRLKF